MTDKTGYYKKSIAHTNKTVQTTDMDFVGLAAYKNYLRLVKPIEMDR